MYWHTATKELPEKDGEYLIVEDNFDETKSIVKFAQRLEFSKGSATVNRFNVFYIYNPELGYQFKTAKRWTELD